jgi:hypothetical protein
MVYNTSLLSNATDVGTVVQIANDATGQIMMAAFTIAIYFILFLTLKRTEGNTVNILMTVNFIIFVISSLLSYVGFLNIKITLFYLAMLGFSILYASINKEY